MVVEYQKQPGGTISTAIKGVYIASPEADQYLRMSEPSTHDLWQTDMDSSSGPNWELSRDVVRSVQNRIRKAVNEFQATLRKKTKPKVGKLKFASDLLATLLSDPINSGSAGRGTKKPAGKKVSKDTGTYISTLISTKRELLKGKVIRHEIWEIELSNSVKADTLARIDFGAWVVADGFETNSADKLVCKVGKNVAGFTHAPDGSYLGVLKVGKKHTFDFRTEPYDQNWALKTDIAVNFPQNEGKSI